MKALPIALVATAFLASASAGWKPEWRQVFGTPQHEVGVSLIAADADRVRVAGSTTGDFANPHAQLEHDVFWAEVCANGVDKIEQERVPGVQTLRGYTSSGRAPHRLKESTLIAEGQESLFTTSAFGHVVAAHRFDGGFAPKIGLARGTFGRHWTVAAERSAGVLYCLSRKAVPSRIEIPSPEGRGVPWIIRSDDRRNLRVALSDQGDPDGKGIRLVALRIGTGSVCWSAFFPTKGKSSFVPRDIVIDQRGWTYISMVDYDRSDWHTRIGVVDPKGMIVSDFRITTLRYFSGWRLALDAAGHLYVAGTEYGEPAYPVLLECVTSDKKRKHWKQSPPYYLSREAATFVRGLHVNAKGDQVTIAGSAHRWGGQPTNGGSDAFVMRLRRENVRGGTRRPGIPVPPINPERSEDPFEQPY